MSATRSSNLGERALILVRVYAVRNALARLRQAEWKAQERRARFEKSVKTARSRGVGVLDDASPVAFAQAPKSAPPLHQTKRLLLDHDASRASTSDTGSRLPSAAKRQEVLLRDEQARVDEAGRAAREAGEEAEQARDAMLQAANAALTSLESFQSTSAPNGAALTDEVIRLRGVIKTLRAAVVMREPQSDSQRQSERALIEIKNRLEDALMPSLGARAQEALLLLLAYEPEEGFPVADLPEPLRDPDALTVADADGLIEFGGPKHCWAGLSRELVVEDGWEFGSVTGPQRRPMQQIVQEAQLDRGDPRIRLRVRLTSEGRVRAARFKREAAVERAEQRDANDRNEARDDRPALSLTKAESEALGEYDEACKAMDAGENGLTDSDAYRAIATAYDTKGDASLPNFNAWRKRLSRARKKAGRPKRNRITPGATRSVVERAAVQ